MRARKKPRQWRVNPRLRVHSGWRTTKLEDCAPVLTAQSALEAELISMAHENKEAVYISNMTAELGFGRLFESVPLFGDNTGALHMAGNSTYSSRTKQIALYFF